MKSATEVVARHFTGFFAGHEIFELDPPADSADRVPGLKLLEIRPGPRVDLVTYVTLGCWDAVQTDGLGHEFVLTAREPDLGHAATLAAAAAHHCGTPAQRLHRGRVVPLGRPWAPGSSCDRLLVTVPYPYGPNLEWCRWRRNTARVLWLMPISAVEHAFVVDAGVDALEARFEALGRVVRGPRASSRCLRAPRGGEDGGMSYAETFRRSITTPRVSGARPPRR